MELRQNKLYHQVTPTSEQASYTEFDQPTFLISLINLFFILKLIYFIYL